MGIDDEHINYEQIKHLARETGQRVTDLIPLAPQNDPFYTGTPGDWALAQWFAQVWHAFGYTHESAYPARALPDCEPEAGGGDAQWLAIRERAPLRYSLDSSLRVEG
jgi:hypothetical protein